MNVDLEGMMMSNHFQHRAPFALVALIAVAIGLGGAGWAEEPAVSAEVGPTVISWETDAEHAGADVRVRAPDGDLVAHSFAAGQPLVLDLSQAFGMPLADGRYSWEIRFRPVLSQQARRELAAATGAEERDAVRRRLIERGELPDEPRVASSSFLVDDGAVWNPNRGGHAAVEEPQHAGGLEVSEEQVISGDLTVYNSICVGFDCATSESFGADTIRLKENNLRIHFEDTSTAAGFSANDWRIVANSNLTGGGSFLAFEDITAGGKLLFRVDAGAPQNALRVESSGNVGFGTGDPVVELHTVDGDTPTLRLEQDGSSGFAPQTWDVAGNETSFFVRDATNDATLPFRIRPGAVSNSLVIDNDSDVGVGVLSPDSTVHVRRSDGTAKVHIQEASSFQDSRILLHLENNGPAGMLMSDVASSVDWLLENDNGQLIISGPGDRAQQVLSPAGVFQLLFRGGEVLRVDRLGNLAIAGTLTEGGARSTAADSELREELEELQQANRTLQERVDQLERLVGELAGE